MPIPSFKYPAAPWIAWALLALATVGAGCDNVHAAPGGTSPDAAAAPVGSPPGAPSLTDVLHAAAGGAPVVLVLVDHAVEARSVDGKLRRVLVAAPVQQAIYDALGDLLWVRRLHEIEVWDLRQAKPVAVPVLADASEEGEFTIAMRAGRVLHWPGSCVVPGTMQINWIKPPSITLLGFDEGEPPRPRLVGARWLGANLERTPRSVTISRVDLPAFDSKQVITLPARVGRCDELRQCGTTVPFGASGWNLVFAGEDPGADCHHFRCLLQDPATGRFGKPPLPRQWVATARANLIGACGLYRFDAAGKWFAIGGSLCAVDGHCNDLGNATPLGWLDGERDIVP